MQLATLGFLQLTYGQRPDAVLELWVFVPVSLLAAHLGFTIFNRISTQQFKTVILSVLAFSCTMLVITGW